MRNHLKGEFLIQIEVTFLLIMIEIPGLWHFKANAVLFPSMIKILIGGGHGPPGPPSGSAIEHLYLTLLDGDILYNRGPRKQKSQI